MSPLRKKQLTTKLRMLENNYINSIGADSKRTADELNRFRNKVEKLGIKGRSNQQIINDFENTRQEKLKQKTFEEVDILEEVNQNSSETVSIVETLNNGLVAEVGLLEKGSAAMFVQNEQADKLKQKFDEIGQSVEQNLVQSLTDAVMGAKTLGQALSNVLRNLQRQLVGMAVQQAVGGIGGIIGNVLGAAFGGGGGGSVPFITDNVFGKELDPSLMLSGVKFANGGKPPVGKASLVGEKGPELFVPSKSGTIIPNHALSGTTNVVVNVDASGSAVQGDDQNAMELGELIGAAIQSEIAKQKMDGGLLS